MLRERERTDGFRILAQRGPVGLRTRNGTTSRIAFRLSRNRCRFAPAWAGAFGTRLATAQAALRRSSISSKKSASRRRVHPFRRQELHAVLR